MRIEVWFNNGLFRAFPKVNEKSLDENDDGILNKVIAFEFGENKHKALISTRNVNFIEFMDEVDD